MSSDPGCILRPGSLQRSRLAGRYATCGPAPSAGLACRMSRSLVAFRVSRFASRFSLFAFRFSLQEQKRFGLSAESLLFEWSKRSNQEKTTPRPRPVCVVHTGSPAVLAGSRPLRNSHIHVLEHARFPLDPPPLLGTPEGPLVPSTRLPAWISEEFVRQDLRVGYRSGARARGKATARTPGVGHVVRVSGPRDNAPMARRPCGPT